MVIKPGPRKVPDCSTLSIFPADQPLTAEDVREHICIFCIRIRHSPFFESRPSLNESVLTECYALVQTLQTLPPKQSL